MLYEVARRVAGMAGFVPAQEALACAEMDNTLTALGVSDEERERLFEVASVIAKAGFDPDDVAEALMEYARRA